MITKYLRGFFIVLTICILAIGLFGCSRNESSKQSSEIKTTDINKDKNENGDIIKNDGDKLSENGITRVKHIVVIDAGHQQYPIDEHESIGPGSSETKPKLSSGASGITTGINEYQLTLDVSLKLRDEFNRRGYEAVMIRENNDCPLSNKERAEIANKYDGIFLRIHANSDQNSSIRGALTLAPRADNQFMSNENINDSQRLSKNVLDSMALETGAKNRGVINTNSMTGINWCKIPVTIVEMGFMSNPEEDLLMQNNEYQQKIAKGIANGVDKFFDENN
ncbi:N-acetylmuramoyl-L-alanine amidase [Peptostreptococcus sp. D1]|uniref:N-acetylmuramoyl-L-alanine amidase n=1 Tax=Peptostreptococcus sp. D1 TaxID=72304 RepID=UPI0008E7E450|nr:N-acetylmuramoyl-L-alanine amidase [Peptostreptococcus sp. D1]SFE24739.1 N-acetylmuramoyl-L-alanine amidase [Peptostreptococcus sp. D1]